MNTEARRALIDYLAWWRDMGVDAFLTEDPVDWIARGDAKPIDPPATPPPPESSRPAVAPPAAPPAPRLFPTAAPDEAERSARELAAAASDLAALSAALQAFDGCALKTTAKNTCVYRGAARSKLMIIGEAPGREEDLEGKPFVGAAGRLLDKMLAAIGLSEADFHIANVVYWRPPGNRTPTPLEAAVCRPFLDRQIELVGPSLIMLLGGVAAKSMLGVADGITKLRGSWKSVSAGGREIPAMPTLHPAYLLRTPIAKRHAWRDLLEVKEALAKTGDGHAD